MLSTCNRAEIYAVAGPEAPDAGRALLRRVPRAAARAPRRAPLRPARRRSRAAPLPRRRRPRLAGGRRAADPRPGEGGLHRRPAIAAHRGADQPAVPHRVRRRQARAHARPASSEGAVSVSYAAIALAQEDLRRPHRPQRADPRRRRDGEADRHAPQGAAGPPDHHRQPHAGRGGTLAPAARRPGRALERARPRARRRRHRHHRHRRGRAGADARHASPT